MVLRDVVGERAHEAHVVHVVVERGAAAAPGVPCQQLRIRTQPRPVRIGDDEALRVRLRVHAAHALRVRGITASAVEHEHQRRGLRRLAAFRQMDLV